MMRKMFRLTNKRRKSLIGLAFISPWLIGYGLFTAWPIGYSFYLSLNRVRITPFGIKTIPLQFENFRRILQEDPAFVEQILVSVKTMLLNVPVIVIFALIIAILINHKIRFRGIFRTIFFLPVIITSGPVINELLKQNATTIPSIEKYGMITLISQSLSPAIADPIIYLFKEIIIVLWFAGVQILIFLAGLQKVDKSLYEAGRIDGASGWELFWKITLPILKPLIIVNVIYTVISVGNFPLNGVIELIKFNMNSALTGYGYSSAMAWLYFAFITIVLLLWVGVLSIRKREGR